MAHDYKKFPELTNGQLAELELMSPHPQIKGDFYATVVKVHDGDTITLETDTRDFTFPLRFLEIDAPELNDGGEITRDWLKDRIEGREVQILIDPNNRVGKYGRLLGKVFYGGQDIGIEEYRLGLATEFGNKNEGEIPISDKILSVKQWF